MNESPTSACQRFAAAVTIIALGAVVGCGDAHVFKIDSGHLDPSTIDVASTAVDGADVQLSRYSATCGADTMEPLLAKIGDGVGFTGEQVESLTPPCLDTPTPGIDIQVERHSIVFDFSNIEIAGAFPEASFEGFLLSIAQDSGTSFLVAATIDYEMTNVDLEPEDLSFGHDRVELNFAGAGYHYDSFVKIDLVFAAVTPSN